MKKILGILLISATSVFAATDVWTSGSGQGITEYNVGNEKNYILRIINAVSAELSSGKTCWLVLENPQSKNGGFKNVELQVFLDDDVFIFRLDKDGDAEMDAKGSREQLFSLVLGLLKTKSNSFTVEIPKIKLKTQFSTRLAKSKLKGALEGCN